MPAASIPRNCYYLRISDRRKMYWLFSAQPDSLKVSQHLRALAVQEATMPAPAVARLAAARGAPVTRYLRDISIYLADYRQRYVD